MNKMQFVIAVETV